jgi:chemotaxis protein methyltransferase CheR
MNPPGRPAAESLADRDFDFVRRLLLERSAVVLEPGKQYLVLSRLAPVARGHGLGSVAALIDRLRSDPANGPCRQVVEALVTTETSFFRDGHPFESLRKVVLPELIRKRAGERRLSLWCAAASTGQEPYSLALLLRESFPELAGWRVALLATDLSGEVLARAREGRYSQIEVNRGLPAALLVKHFR